MHPWMQGNMEEDGERVNMLFAKAPQVGIRVQVHKFVDSPAWHVMDVCKFFCASSHSDLLRSLFGAVEINNR